MAAYRHICFGVDRGAIGDVPRHLHHDGYANLVLSGGFTEAAFAGRTRAVPGVVLLHGPFDAHANIEGTGRGSTIVRLPWHGGAPEGAYHVTDPDLLARLVEVNPCEAESAMMEMLSPVTTRDTCWIDRLARALADEGTFEFGEWADANSISAASLSRGFRNAYGVTAQRFRLEARTRKAWRRVMTEPAALTRIAHECDFADLAHMTRSIKAMTGAAPSAWRCHLRDVPLRSPAAVLRK